jgi:hypothetical protein
VFEDTVSVYEIVDAEFPGYVYLLRVGELNKRLNTNTYEFMMSTDTNEYLQHLHSRARVIEEDWTLDCMDQRLYKERGDRIDKADIVTLCPLSHVADTSR